MDLENLQDTPPWAWPEDAGQTLLRTLRDPSTDPAERQLAAELAGDLTVVNDEIASALLAVVRDANETEELRSIAAIALGPALEQAEMFGVDDPEDSVLSEARFREIRQTLRQLYYDAKVPEEVRRRVLEASVRAPQDWQRDAVRAAYSSADPSWVLTAVFCMRFVRGFADQILAALDSDNPEIRYEAVCAAGNWGIDGAWGHVSAILGADAADKPLLIAAIEAATSIRPEEATEMLVELSDSEDEDIADAANEALAMADGLAEFDDDDEDENPFH